MSLRNIFYITVAVWVTLFLSQETNAAETEVEPFSVMTSVLMKTNMGNVTLELNTEKAPQTVANFLGYVNDGFYNDLIFHRVIKGFMVQGGGFNTQMQQQGTRAPVQNEADNGLKNDKYSIAMARTSDPHSATAQFFINTKDNDFLNFSSADVQGYGYAVFGKVTEGFDIVDQIEKVRTGRVGPFSDVPKASVVIESMTILADNSE